MTSLRIVDVTEETAFRMIPPCADPGFDHRSCDYWEDADRGSKAARRSWLDAPAEAAKPAEPRRPVDNPFAPPAKPSAPNPFARSAGDPGAVFNPFADEEESSGANPFAPTPVARPTLGSAVPPKLALLGRGLAVFGSYAKVAVVEDVAVAYSQFGPLTAYPRAQRLRDLYPQLPEAPLPAVITCIASTPEARRSGHATRLVLAVCDDLAARGFAAVEAYPERRVRPDATSAATPDFWVHAGFDVAVDDERFPVVRRELA